MIRAIGFLFILLAARAPAEVIHFTDRATFTAASANLQAIDFEGLPSTPEFGVLLLNDVGFRGINGVIPVTAPHFGYTGPGTALVNIGVPEISGIAVTLPSGVTAVGTDLLANPPDNVSPIVISLPTGESFIVSGDPLPVRQFVGFTSDLAIASVAFVSNASSQGAASRIGLDDVVFGQVQGQPIPEPTTLILLITGLATLAAAIHRRRNYPRCRGGSS